MFVNIIRIRCSKTILFVIIAEYLQCDVCRQLRDILPDLKLHIIRMHRSKLIFIVIIVENQSTTSNRIKCDVCEKLIKISSESKVHIIRMHISKICVIMRKIPTFLKIYIFYIFNKYYEYIQVEKWDENVICIILYLL